MATGRLIEIMRDGENKPCHMLIIRKERGKSCHCDSRIPIINKRRGYISFGVPLTCPVCEKERQRWASWWAKVEEQEREAERQNRS